MPIEEAATFFEAIPAIHRHLKTLVDVGLGYVRLGQPAPTLSGGEAQRVKLASELQKRSTGRTVYVLDEPTTGLHFEDIRKLLHGAGEPGRQGQHGHRHRAQPRRHQDRRLADRHGPGGRPQGRPGDRGRHARGGGRGAGAARRASFLRHVLGSAGEPKARGQGDRARAAKANGDEAPGPDRSTTGATAAHGDARRGREDSARPRTAAKPRRPPRKRRGHQSSPRRRHCRGGSPPPAAPRTRRRAQAAAAAAIAGQAAARAAPGCARPREALPGGGVPAPRGTGRSTGASCACPIAGEPASCRTRRGLRRIGAAWWCGSRRCARTAGPCPFTVPLTNRRARLPVIGRAVVRLAAPRPACARDPC